MPLVEGGDSATAFKSGCGNDKVVVADLASRRFELRPQARMDLWRSPRLEQKSAI
jgi:hypothetical protein